MENRKKIEISSIARLIDELDYYQILKVPQTASPMELKAAYFRESREYHPDKYFNEPEEFKVKVTLVFKRITEAYKILSNQETRAEYTKELRGPDRALNLRYVYGAAQKKEDVGKTPLAKKYFEMGKLAFQNMDYKGAKINFQLALQLEPDNETFKGYAAQVKAKLGR